MNGLLRVPEVARRYGLHEDTVRRAIKRGELSAVRAFGRTWVREEELERLLTPRKAVSDEEAAGQAR